MCKKISFIKKKLTIAQERQKKYVNQRKNKQNLT